MNTGRLSYKSLRLRIVHIPNLHGHRVSTWKLRKMAMSKALKSTLTNQNGMVSG